MQRLLIVMIDILNIMDLDRIWEEYNNYSLINPSLISWTS